MYRVYIADHNGGIGDPLIYEPNHPNLVFTAAKFVNEVDAAGSFSFTIPRNHPSWHNIHRMSTRVWITEDRVNPSDPTKVEVMWYGRVYDIRRDFNNNKIVTCEGAMAFLKDIALPPYTYLKPGKIDPATGIQGPPDIDPQTPKDHLKTIIEVYNLRCTPARKTGKNDDPNKGIYLDPSAEGYAIVDGISQFVTVYDEIKNRIINGSNPTYVMYPQYGLDPDTGLPFFNIYIQNMPWYTDTTQTIAFAQNILDIEECCSSDDIYTSIAASGSGSLSVYDHTLFDMTPLKDRKYWVDYYDVPTGPGSPYGSPEIGVVDKIISFNSIGDRDELIMAAKKTFEYDGGKSYSKFKVSAVDLNMLNVDYGKIRAGYSYHVVSTPHNIDVWYVCTKVETDMLNPANSKYEFSLTKQMTAEALTNRFYDEVTGLYRAINDKIDINRTYGCIQLRQNELRLVLSESDTGGGS